MNRRRFLQFLGLAPVVAAAPKLIDIEEEDVCKSPALLDVDTTAACCGMRDLRAAISQQYISTHTLAGDIDQRTLSQLEFARRRQRLLCTGTDDQLLDRLNQADKYSDEWMRINRELARRHPKAA